jgi:transposase
MVFRTRDLLVRQRTQTINALRGHLAEHGVIAPQGLPQIGQLVTAIDDPNSRLPSAVRELGRLLLEQIAWLDTKIAGLAKAIRAAATQDEEVARLMTMPGVGPICAMAIRAFAPPLESFGRARDFAAWLGIVPRQLSTGGKARLGKTSRMGQRDIRRLLITGAMTVVRWAVCRGAPAGSWLDRMIARKPKMLVAMALANKMARMIWAMTTRKESYRAPMAAAA